MPKKREEISRFNLLLSEDTYSSQNAQTGSPNAVRRLLSLIPSGAGDLVRELPEPAYLATNLGSAVVALFEFDHNDASGNVIREYFAATATTLYRNNGAGAWASVSAVGTLNGPIQAQS